MAWRDECADEAGSFPVNEPGTPCLCMRLCGGRFFCRCLRTDALRHSRKSRYDRERHENVPGDMYFKKYMHRQKNAV